LFTSRTLLCGEQGEINLLTPHFVLPREPF
jgi:hypothetical protein